jgi:uncharacterized membrane protein YdjX (TVP38/TMEM64 family)/rhodanese-related sulfurtransferase
MNATRVLRLALFLLLAAGIAIALAYREDFSVESLRAWIEQAGAAAPLAFMAAYAAGTVLFLPGWVMTVTGGALFGPAWGTLYNLTGATLGATLAFLVSRYLASDWVARKAGGRLKQLIEGVEQEGWRFVAFVRLVPLFPFNLLNYALGLTRIRLSHYVIASYVCMFPGALAYTYLGFAGREAVAGGEGVIQKALLALALLALVAFLPRFIKRLRRKPVQAASFPSMDVAELKRQLDGRDDVVVLDVRSREEFTGPLGHIDGAVNIPIQELAARLGEIEAHREGTIALVCRTERRSAQAATLLSQAGFRSPVIVTGGMEAWNRHGLPVEHRGIGDGARNIPPDAEKRN